MSYCFNSCSLIKFAREKSPSQGGAEERGSDSQEGEEEEERGRRCGHPAVSLHHSIAATSRAPSKCINDPDHLTRPRAAFLWTARPSLCLWAKCNKVVLNRVGPGHRADSLPRHGVSDNKQGTDLNFIKPFVGHRRFVCCINISRSLGLESNQAAARD